MCILLHPERMKIHPKGNPTIRSTVLPPPLPIETTFQQVGAEFFFFSRSCIFHGYFLFNLAPRGPQLATKMAPAFLGLAGALHCDQGILDSMSRGQISLVRGHCNSCLGKQLVNEGTTAIPMTVEGHQGKFKNCKWASRQTMHLLSFD